MTEKYIYADVEKPFHFWVREGQRWILRDGAALPPTHALHTHAHATPRHDGPGHGSAAT
jgi:hypothetical protein